MGAKIEIKLPCKAHELEMRLHAFCDHYGMDADVNVVLSDGSHSITITEADCQHHEREA